MGYSRKSTNRGVEDIKAFLKIPLEFFIYLLYPWKFQTQIKAPPMEIVQNCTLENSKTKNQKEGVKFFFI